jgi:alcohol dehydrogenase
MHNVDKLALMSSHYSMLPFDFELRTQIVFGLDAIDRLGALGRELGGRRALVVSDAEVVSAGHTERGVSSLEEAGFAAAIFRDFHQNPSTADVERGVGYASEFAPDLLVGLGGGSSIDCAKGINFLYTNGGRMQDYWGVGRAAKPMLPMIAVPTTAGTGSEAQSFALISDAATHAKMACGDKKAACRMALLDPRLTVTQPRRVTALTGMDAVAHALETYVTKRRNPASQIFSREAWRLLAGNLPQVLENQGDLDARGAMQWGACCAGLAIENSMLGATHALANPLTAEYGLVHGEAIGVMLPHVIRYNGEHFGDLYLQLMQSTAGLAGYPDPADGVEGLALFATSLVEQCGLATRLSQCGVSEAHIPRLAEDAAKQWTGTFNPRPVGAAELAELYRRAY